MRRKLASLGASAALTAAMVAVPVTPAAADPPPTCVYTETWSSWTWKFARATNLCSTGKRFKFIWAWAADGSCYYYVVRASRTENRGPQARFDGLNNC